MFIISRLVDRIFAWARVRQARQQAKQQFLFLIELPPAAPIMREVSAQGVRVLSLCHGCGARLERSATLCGECVSRQSRQTS